MTVPIYQMEGTWEEITHCVPPFAGQRLRVEIYPVEESIQSAQDDPRLEILREIAERTGRISPQADIRDWLREGRAGVMFGYAPLASLALTGY